MDLAERKYRLIQELVGVEDETVLGDLERVLKREKEDHQKISRSDEKELSRRLEEYQKDPQSLLDWDKVKNDW